MKTILVVEDDPDTRETLMELLSDHGYAVAGSWDGKDALRQMLDCPPDVLLLDLVLPSHGWMGAPRSDAVRTEARGDSRHRHIRALPNPGPSRMGGGPA